MDERPQNPPSFRPRLLSVDGSDGHLSAPAPFSGRMDEATLEGWVVRYPEVLGEPLLVLGSQLAEFEEDKDRLDVLALDRAGELVLVELKANDSFRVSDLQALAYAGAYATRETRDLAAALAERPEFSSSSDPQAVAEAAIIEWTGLDDFEQWCPSEHVRIKLVAPGFPRRVLRTVKWLGDVYLLRLEAIVVALFEPEPGRYSLTFERLLPLPDERRFDMTVREDRREREDRKRRPDVLPTLVEHGRLVDGQTLWLSPVGLPDEVRRRYDPSMPIFQVRLHLREGALPRVMWRPSEGAEVECLAASKVPSRVCDELADGPRREESWAVGTNFLVRPGGETLQEIAALAGLWPG